MDNRLLFLMNQAHKSLFKAADTSAKTAVGISATQMTALFYLKQHDGCLLKDLANGLSMNNSAVSGLVDRMEKQRLVTRKTSSEDGRSFQVWLTDKAQLLIPESFKVLRDFNGKMTEGFSLEEQDVVLRFLHHLIQLSRNTTEQTEYTI